MTKLVLLSLWFAFGIADMYRRFKQEQCTLDVIDWVAIIILGSIVGPCVLMYQFLGGK